MNINEEMKLHKWAGDMAEQKSRALSPTNLCIENKRKQIGDVHFCIGRRMGMSNGFDFAGEL